VKPIKLTLQAFGPFASAEEVDFTLLGANPLFLINGPTGAGKSSILDAICFSLYGHTTGAEREPSQMRCDFADPTLITEVSFEFSLGDKQYRARRVPMQEKPKKYAEGTTTQVAEAQLWELDGSEEGKLLVSKSVSDANFEIKRLIGLDIDQFRQVMVLPQGKFRDLLLADSRDREKIFSQLFQTSIYKRIEDQLRSKASRIKQDVENHQNQIRGILQAAEVNTEDEVTAVLTTLAPELSDALQARTKAESDKKASETEKDQAEQLIKRFDELGQKQTQLAAKIEEEAAIKSLQQKLDESINARTIQPVYANAQTEAAALNKLQKELTTSADHLKQVEQRKKTSGQLLEEAKQNAKEITALTKQQAELEQQEKLCIELQKKQGLLATAEADLKASSAHLNNKQEQRNTLNAELEIGEKSIKTILSELESLAEKQIALNKLGSQLEQRQELEVSRQQEVTQAEAEAVCQQDHKNAEDFFKQAETAAKKTELGWHAGQAALLARELKEDEPCPVCGSKEHPSPASDDNELVGMVAVDNARAAGEVARSAMDSARQTWDQAANALAQTRKECQRLTTQLGSLAADKLTALQATYNKGKDEFARLLAKQEKQRQLQERIEVIRAEQAALNVALETASQQVAEHNEQVIRIRAGVDQLLASIPEALRETEALEEKLSVVKSHRSQLAETLEKSEQEQIAARSEFDKLTSHHAALEKHLSDQRMQTSETSAVWSEAIKKSLFGTDEEFQAAVLEEDEQEALKIAIDAYRSELDALKGAIQQMQNDVAAKERPELEVIEITLGEKTDVYNQTDETWRALTARNNQLKEIQKKLDQAHKKNEALEAEYRVIGTLSEVANGQTGNKISLQRFVLSVLLDDVLIQASQRLTLMSKGRYQLVRKEDRAKGNKASGLELEVEDGYTGKTRSVATLSGGESFMAALSLALGLSDVVQSYAGGIKLDTLFIDEGFGSLDLESLDLAIRTLIDLQASGRMIGIISHVSELKEQMALRLDVVIGRSGSHISTIAI
jgi:exonuclease SbcC